jgi:hypothetical protein
MEEATRTEPEAAEERGVQVSESEAREIVDGTPYEEWKSTYRKDRLAA